MKRVILISSPPCGVLATLILSLSVGFASRAAEAPGNLAAPAAAVHDLTPLHDATRVLVNPDKGWYHHCPDNPELTRELLNRCGYWLFPKSIELPESLTAGGTVPLRLTVENRGVAPPYASYELRVKLSGPGAPVVLVLANDCKSWLPGTPVSSRYDLSLPSGMKPGGYTLSLGLFDVRQGKDRPVEFALKASVRDADGYYQVASVTVSRSPTLTK